MLDQVVPHRPQSLIAAPSKSALNISHNLDQATRSRWETALLRAEKSFPRGACFAPADDSPSRLFVVLEGWVQKYRQLSDGRRQVTGFCLPGEACDLNPLFQIQRGHSLAALTAVRVAALDRAQLLDLMAQGPELKEALLRADMVAANVTTEWLVGTGVKSAQERVAHLLCELFIRQNPYLIDTPVGLPATQVELAEATGLTSVHANRVLRDLRMRYGVSVRNRKLHIPDFAALAKVAHFQRNYLGFDDS